MRVVGGTHDLQTDCDIFGSWSLLNAVEPYSINILEVIL